MNKLEEIPKIVIFFTFLSILGAFSPLYGITVGSVKITFFRLGLIPLLIMHIKYFGNTINNILKLFIIFLVFRFVSLYFSDQLVFGFTQIEWFSEGLAYLLVITYLANRYKNFSIVYSELIIVLGSFAVGFILAQAVAFFIFGKLLYPPFWHNYANIVSSDIYWNYPIYGIGRIIGTFAEPNMAGTMCAFFFAVLLPIYYHSRKNKILYLTLIILTVISSIFTGSRQSLVCISLTLFIYFFYFRKSNKKKLLTMLGFFIIIFVLIYNSDSFSSLEESENVFTRIKQGTDDDDVSGGRFELLKYTWENFGFHNIFLGAGEGSTGGGGHNAFLAVFIENGIFTFFVFILMLVKMTIKPYYTYKRSHKIIDISATLISITWAFLMFVNWAQLNQSISFVFLAFVFISLRKNCYNDNSFIGLIKNR